MNGLDHMLELLSKQRAVLGRAMRGGTAEMTRALDEADRLADLLQRRALYLRDLHEEDACKT